MQSTDKDTSRIFSKKKSLKKKILTLLKHKHLLTAPNIVGRLKIKGDAYNKTSVYRALDALLYEGKICKQLFKDNNVYYELRSNHHDHFVCELCEKIAAIPCQQIIVPTNLGTVSHHHATWYGICTQCR